MSAVRGERGCIVSAVRGERGCSNFGCCGEERWPAVSLGLVGVEWGCSKCGRFGED